MYAETLTSYKRDINRFQPLAKEREAELISQARSGDEDSLNQLINANLHFVVSLAYKYGNNSSDIAELISEGNIGLIQAAERYDGDRDCKFISYASWWVKHNMIKALAKSHKDRQRMAPQHLSEDRLTELGGYTQDNPGQERLHKKRVLDALRQALAILDEREHKIVSDYFGLDRRDAKSLKEIGQDLDLTEERVRQIRDRALKRIHSVYGHALKAIYAEPTPLSL